MGNLVDVIKYEGDNTSFVWKHPVEDFNTMSQLIVQESQEAVFFMNGQILDVFGPGRHTLETQNIPLIGKFFNKVFDGDSPFSCKVYFINKTEQMAIRWGTNSKIEYIDPSYGFPLQIGASGTMHLRVDDSRKLLVKIVGNEMTLDQDTLIHRFRGVLMTRFKTYTANYIKNTTLNIFEIDEKLIEISERMQALLIPDFLDYGISLERFFVTTIAKPEEDETYQKFKALHFRQYADIAEAKLRQSVDIIDQETITQKMIMESEGLAQKRKIEGYSYHQERGFDVAEKFADSDGGVTDLGVGLGVMGAVAGTMGGMIQDSLGFSASPIAKEMQCGKCNTLIPSGGKFCLECGTKTEDKDSSIMVCPNCSNETPKGKFCMECGYKLIRLCPNCDSEVSPNAKFCLECGERVGGV